MKKNTKILIIPALILIMISFSGCNKPKNTNSYEKWVWTEGDISVTLNLYPVENKFCSNVDGDFYTILFLDNDTLYYQMVGDTMYVKRENESFPTATDRYNKWLIHQHTEQHLEMEYVGTLPAVPRVINYLFNPKN